MRSILRRIGTVVVIAATSVLAIGGGANAATVTSTVDGTSGGYEVLNTKGGVTYVSADWVIPAIRDNSAAGSAYFTLVRLDGVGVIGVASEWIAGQASYGALGELSGQSTFMVGSPVKAGDHMRAEAEAIGHTGWLVVTDVTRGWTHRYSNPITGTGLTGAGIVVQRSNTPLPDFGTTRFTNVRVNHRSIDDLSSIKVTMVDSPITATPSKLSDSSFTIAWQRTRAE